VVLDLAEVAGVVKPQRGGDRRAIPCDGVGDNVLAGSRLLPEIGADHTDDVAQGPGDADTSRKETAVARPETAAIGGAAGPAAS
jgi:hypothetical protein